MNTLTILLAQTKSEATIEIILMLLGSAIIAYLTSWLYYKSIYEKRIKVIESEKHELNNRIVNLDAEIFDLKKSLGEKDKEMEHLIMVHISERKHLLDYKGFGTATADEKDDLKMISGIGPFIEERLNALDIYTFRQISKFTPQDISTINDAIEYFSGRIERDEWVAQARELVRSEDLKIELFKRISERKEKIYYDRIGIAKKEEADDLTIISGIGGWIQEKLNVLDIFTYRQISNFTKDDIETVTEAIEYFPGRIERDEWILQARELIRIAGKKSELLKRIRDRKGRIYYDRLGIAHKHEANNLTLIDGLGLWVEERLNTLGIYTFSQISKLTHADIETITEVLEIIPGRIEQDNWVGQARELAKNNIHESLIIP
jgi:predicted flap endonuclease-1-like 5' DNA nuclease